MSMLTITGTEAVRGQGGEGLLARTAPYLPFQEPDPARYNLKWGRMTGRLNGALQIEGNDNINLSAQGKEADVAITPQVGVGFLWAMSQSQVMQFDLGLGYRWYVSHPSLNSIYITPDTHWDYRMRIKEVRIEVHDDFQIQADATSQREISGEQESLLDFRRFNNTAGLTATWQINRRSSVAAGYDYGIDRSLSDDFAQLDRDNHSASFATYQTLNPRWTVGLLGNYTVFEYVEKIQNDGVATSAGPVIAFQPSEFIVIDASFSYSQLQFDRTGTLTDTEDFNGIAYQVGIRQRLNSRFNHQVQFRQNAEVGYGSNFTEVFAAQYGLTMRLSTAMQMNTHFAYESFSLSGPDGESANRFLFQADTRIRLARRWNLALGYSFSWKLSELENRDYQQNRLTLELTRQF